MKKVETVKQMKVKTGVADKLELIRLVDLFISIENVSAKSELIPTRQWSYFYNTELFELIKYS